MQHLVTDVNRLNEPLSLEIIESKSEANGGCLLARKYPSLFVVLSGVDEALFAFFDDPHELLRLDLRAVVFETLAAIFFSLVVFALRDQEICDLNPSVSESCHLMKGQLRPPCVAASTLGGVALLMRRVAASCLGATPAIVMFVL